MKYYINSNTGDCISENEGVYKLHLLTRYDPIFLPSETIDITYAQFITLKGFIPIKKKKLSNRTRKKYGPTLSDGSKGNPSRVYVPTKAEAREELLKQLGL
jgi:hypothetical protein